MWAKLIMANSRAEFATRFVLAALAESAGKDKITQGSVGEVARWTGLSERQVQREIKTLVAMGELRLEVPGGGRGRPAKYRIMLEWRESFWPERVKKVQSRAPFLARKG